MSIISLCTGQKQTKVVENNSNNKHEQREENNTVKEVRGMSSL